MATVKSQIKAALKFLDEVDNEVVASVDKHADAGAKVTFFAKFAYKHGISYDDLGDGRDEGAVALQICSRDTIDAVLSDLAAFIYFIDTDTFTVRLMSFIEGKNGGIGLLADIDIDSVIEEA